MSQLGKSDSLEQNLDSPREADANVNRSMET